jgi:hypothetical protein
MIVLAWRSLALWQGARNGPQGIKGTAARALDFDRIEATRAREQFHAARTANILHP